MVSMLFIAFYVSHFSIHGNFDCVLVNFKICTKARSSIASQTSVLIASRQMTPSKARFKRRCKVVPN